MEPSIPSPISTPSPYLPWIVFGVMAAVVVTVMLARWYFRHLRRKSQEIEVVVTGAVDSTPPMALPSGDDRSLTSRELRMEEIRKHVTSSHFDNRSCLYCPQKAEKPFPVFVPVRSPIDAVFRYLNVVRLDRWRIDLEPFGGPTLLCSRHHERARGLMELELAEVLTEGAAFMDKQRRRIQTYEAYELDEQLFDDVKIIKKGRLKKPQRVAPEPANVRQLKAASDKT